MTTDLDPIATSDAIVATYRRYLGSLLPLRDGDLAQAIHRELAAESAIARGPLLEMTPPFIQGATLRQLLDEGVLSPTFSKLFSPALPADRPLYLHQEQ